MSHQGPTLDGMSCNEWLDFLRQQSEDFDARFTAHTERIRGGIRSRERWPTLVAIGLGEALDSVERVTAWAQKGKHPGPKWAGQTVPHQTAKLLGHLARGLKGEEKDEDTGESPFAHVAARALMLLGLVLRGNRVTLD